MNSTRAFWKWSAIGLAVAIFLAWAQATAVGGVAGMLEVGETSALRPLITEQLGDVPLAPGPGHDGQIYYAIGLDLGGSEVPPLLDHAAYRYRRILSPATSSLLGLLNGWPLLWAQLSLGIASMALATGMVAAMSVRAGRNELRALTVVLNPGVWLSVQLLTPDAFSLALMVVALYAVTAGRSSRGAVAFGLSALAKDVSLATPVPLSVQRRDWRLGLIPLLVLGLWMSILTLRFGGGFSSRGNLDWPLAGLVAASSNWSQLEAKEWVYLVFALVSVLVGIVFSLRRSWLRWPVAAWTTLAIISSNWVWDFGNNAARAFAPIIVLVALASTYTAADTVSGAERRAVGT